MVKPILLIGMMGCGKSTLGQMLAKRLGRAFIDLDGEIERREGRSIPDIFAAEGDAGFSCKHGEKNPNPRQSVP